MAFLPRSIVNDRLRLSVPTSYRILGSPRRYGARINTDHVLELLNRSRRGPQPILTFLPDDLMTADELADRLADSFITAHDILNWSSRVKNTIPHFRLSAHARRFSLPAVLAWLGDNSVGSRRAS